jgi:hypothetical protein
MSGESIYIRKQKEDELMYEALCKRCGTCCGAGSKDPCASLRKGPDGKYYCDVYDHRIGQRTTVSGNSFTCVPIRDVLTYAPPYPGCGYNNNNNNNNKVSI